MPKAASFFTFSSSSSSSVCIDVQRRQIDVCIRCQSNRQSNSELNSALEHIVSSLLPSLAFTCSVVFVFGCCSSSYSAKQVQVRHRPMHVGRALEAAVGVRQPFAFLFVCNLFYNFLSFLKNNFFFLVACACAFLCTF